MAFVVSAMLVAPPLPVPAAAVTAPAPTPVPVPEVLIAPPEPPAAVPLPNRQQQVLAAITSARSAYAAGSTQLQKGAARPERAEALCAALGKREAVQWIGTVETLSTNSEGKGVMALAIGDGVTVKTWNNVLSDLGSQTLIEPKSALFKTARTLATGDRVRFSGRFYASDTDCIQETSVTLHGSITEPEFLMRFSALEPLK